MLEKHPFGDFVPRKARYLVIGSFVGKYVPGYNWYYSNQRNQLWPIIESVYSVKLARKSDKQKLFRQIGIAICDIIQSCERKSGNNLDTNLSNITYNTEGIRKIVRTRKIEKIYFTSKFVEKKFKREFNEIILKYPRIELVSLPSPSPRYATMNINDKIALYKKLLPKLK